MLVGFRLIYDQFTSLKDNKIGDKISIITYCDETYDTNIIGINIHLQYGEFIITTVVSNQLKNSISELTSYDFRHTDFDEPLYYDEEYQSIELEIIDITNDPKDDINQDKCSFYGLEEYCLYNRIVQSSAKYGLV